MVVDFLNMANAKKGALTLELIPEIVPSVGALLDSPHKRYRDSALGTLSAVLRNFGHLIRETLHASPNLGVDISFEERQEKCEAAKTSLEEILPQLQRCETQPGMSARKARELRKKIEELDS